MTTEFGAVPVQPRTLVFVDLSNFAHTCFWPAYDAYLADKQKYPYTRVLFTNVEGKLGTMGKDFEDGGVTNPAFIFVEDRTSKRKYGLFPGYKADRGADDDAEKAAARAWLKAKGIPGVKEWLKAKGYTTFCYSEDNEADDTIATLATQVAGKANVVIASSDKDLWQLYNPPTIDIYHMTKGVFLDPLEISKKFHGLADPKLIPLDKALWGDTSDTIPNAVPRMQKQLVPLINESGGDLSKFWALTKSVKLTDTCKRLLETGANQVGINYALAKLDTACDITWERGQ